ncbi:hypothetical protein DYB35_007442 [Aphanomyces astaci]|uniref:Uncharacterized protein n=1 Tax=Aphanomyces astaci TaxID=112090 RepID=A0A418CNE3_APHAT|nr:hypothetical protein DYB35_007442 [Aphanomyces astaci]
MEAYPVELKEVPRPLVAALGPKDLQARVLPVLRSINEEFVPQLQIKSLSFDHRFVFPIKKDKSTSLSPPPSKGIWKTDWLKKHHEVLPSVVLLLYAFEPRLATRDWAIQETVIRDEVEDLRRMLSGRDVKILLVLVQLLDDAATTASPSTSSSMVNVPSSDDRLQSLRKRAELDAKSVWLLKDIVSRTHPTLIKLEAAIRMNAIEYYKAQAKRVKKAKNPSKLMAARHSFKVAHYYEFRQHMSKMVVHYEAAYKSLLHMAVSSSSVEVQTQVRAVAEFVHFKLVYHALLTNRQLKTAVDQLHRHMASPVSQIPPNDDICMHWGYMSRQYHVFGQLMVEAQRRGGPPPPPTAAAANPIDSDLYKEVYLYFSVAAKYATRRRQAAAKAGLSYDPNQPPAATSPPPISPSMYLGMANQSVAETSIPHAALAIHLLTQALHHVTDDVAHHRHRLKHRLGLRLALEHLANREYSVARQGLQLASTVYIQERWYGLVSEILGHLVTCARHERDTAAFLELSMQLLSPKLEPYVSARFRDTVHANLFVAFDHVTSSQMTLPDLSLDDDDGRRRLTASLISVAIHCTNSALVATFESGLPVDVAFHTLGFVFTQDEGGAPCVVELHHETTADLLLSPHIPRTFQVPVTPFPGTCQQVRFGLRNRHHVPWTWTLAGPFAAQPRHRLVRRNSLLPEINGRVPGMGQGAGSPSFQRQNLRHGTDPYLVHEVDKATVDLVSTSPVLVHGVTCLEFVLHAPSTDHVHHPRCAVNIDDQSSVTVLSPVSQDQLISPQLAQSDQQFQVVMTCHSPGPVLLSVHVAYETTRGEYVQLDIPFTVHAVLPVTLSTAKTDGVATVNGSGFMLVAHVKAAVAPLRIHKLALKHVTPYATIVQSGGNNDEEECATPFLGAGDAHSLVLHVTPREVTVSHILAHVLVQWSSLDHPEHVVSTELALPSMAFQPAPLSVKIDDMPVFGTQGHVTWVHVRLTNHTISGYIVDVKIGSDSSEFLVAGVVDGHNVQVLPMETISVTIGLVPLQPGHLTLPKVEVVHVDSNETFRVTDQRVTLFVVPDNHTTSAAMLLA